MLYALPRVLMLALVTILPALPGSTLADEAMDTGSPDLSLMRLQLSPSALPPVWFHPRPPQQSDSGESGAGSLPAPENTRSNLPGLGPDGAEGESLWLDRPGKQLESEVAFSQALDALLPDAGLETGLRLGAGAYGDQQAFAMGWLRPVQDNTLLNFSFSSEPDLGEMTARGGILIHW